MSLTLSAHFLPQLTTPEALRGATVVVIDVLRATTTIAHALAAGARDVVPCREIEEVYQRAGRHEREMLILGGERGGLQIERFDLGNSPAEYTPEIVNRKTILFTTTNGTKAMQHCLEAERVVLGSLVNLQAVCDAIAGAPNVHLLCAGTHGELTREDVLAAGGIVYKLTRLDEGRMIDDSANLARAAWRGVVAGAIAAGEPLAGRLAAELRETRGGRNLISIGHEHDLIAAAAIDTLDVVPELNLDRWRIHLP